MNDVYYVVPEHCIFLDKKYIKLLDIENICWAQINIGIDLRKKKYIQTQQDFGIIDIPEQFAGLLWSLKMSEESLYLYSKEALLEGETAGAIIKDRASFEKTMNDLIGISSEYIFIYRNDDVLSKFIDITEGEIIEIYCREAAAEKIEEKLSMHCKKVDYYEYELDLYD